MSGWIIVCLLPSVGGTDRVAQALHLELRRRGIPGRLLAPLHRLPAGRQEALRRWHADAGAEISAGPHELSRRGFGRIIGLARWYRRQPEAVVNLHPPTLDGVGLPDLLAVRLSGRRCVLTIHHPQEWGALNLLRKLLLAGCVALAHDLVVSTPHLRANLAETVPGWLLRRRLKVIPVGVAPPARTVSREAARKALDIGEEEVVAVTVSRLAPGKGLGAILQGCRDLGPGRLLLLLAGDGPLRPELEADAPPWVRLLGPVASIEPVLAAADFFVLPSTMEGFGLVYVEAALRGLASIACPVGGVPYAIADEVTGLLVAEGDSAALRDAMGRLSSDGALRGRLAAAARERAEREQTVRTMAGRYLACFDVKQAA